MRRIVPGLYTFEHLPVGRVYLLTEGDGLTLIDTSVGYAAKSILAQIQKMGFAPTELRRILVTHAHFDHIGGLPALVKATGAAVWAAPLERPVVEGTLPTPLPPAGSVPGLVGLIRLKPVLFPHIAVARELSDGEILDEVFGGLQVLSTPGHTPGHISFWHPERRVLITGDVMMNLPTGLSLPFAAATYAMGTNIQSIAKLTALEPPIACFGHGPPMFVETARRIAAFARTVGAI